MAHDLNLDEFDMRRKRLGLSVAEVARRAGVPERTVRYAVAGRSVQAGTLDRLSRVLVEAAENPLVRTPADAMTPAAMAKYDREHVAKLERQAEQREELAKSAGDVRTQLQAADAQRVALRKQAEGLAELAGRMAADGDFTKEDIVDQLLGVHPELVEPYDEIRREQLATAEAGRIGAPLGRDVFGEPMSIEDTLQDDDGWLERERALRQPSSTEVAMRKAEASRGGSDLTDQAETKPRGVMEWYAAARNAAAKADRADLLADDGLDQLFAWYLQQRKSTAKADRMPVSKADVDAWTAHLASPAGASFLGDLVRVQLAKAGKSPVRLPDTYDGIARMDPEAKHAFIANTSNPDQCVACGNSLGHDNHWTDAS